LGATIAPDLARRKRWSLRRASRPSWQIGRRCAMLARVTHAIEIRTSLDEPTIDGLASLLVAVVDDGASVSFLPPLAHADAAAFWRAQQVGTRGAFLIARREEADDAAIDGAVMLVPAWAPNQPHRAEVAKLLVHPRARRRGIARRLMHALEERAAASGFALLTLDTWQGDRAESLYRSMAWREVGVIPDFALLPDGRYGATVIFYKPISPRSAR
jgi:ribosomal protein S18 acetylase RimI-like enzyme